VTLDYTDIRKTLWRLTLPLFFDIALVMLVGAVDTVMLSRCGDSAVAAVGMVNQIVVLVFLAYQFLATGSGILCAQYFGAGERRRLEQTVALSLLFNTILGLAAGAALYFGAERLLEWSGLRGDVLPHGLTYLKITGPMTFFTALSLTFSASFRSVGKVTEPMAVNIISNIVNAVGNWALIFGHLGFPALGVAGAAWATAFARFVQFALLAAIHTSRHIKLFPMSLFRPFPWRELRNLFHVGIPAMSEEISYSLSQLAVVYFINSISTDALTTKAYCSNLIMFVFLFCLAATHGGDILVGHLVGRKRYSPAYLVGTFFLRRSMAVTLVCSAMLAAAAPFILPLLTNNPEIISTGCIILALDVVLEIGRVRNIFACGTLRAAGDVIYPVVVGVIVQWSVGVGVAWLLGLPLDLGLVGVWIGFLLDENIRGIILMRRWHSLRWTGKSFAS
jgi:putative MATE family efflux protein